MKKNRVLIAGAYSAIDAYPNVKFRILLMQNDPSLDIEEFNAGSPSKVDYETKFGQLLSLLRLALSLFLVNIRALVKIVRVRRTVEAVYIPYPAVPLLWLISLLPIALRPKRIVADVFISLYDTVVIDRQLLSKSKWPAKLLKNLERRAITAATISITDTPENSAYYAGLFEIDPNHFSDLPLSIDRIHFSPSTKSDSTDLENLKVLFIGTLVPLHGIDVLCKAINLIDEDSAVSLTIVGDGQHASIVGEFMKNHKRRASKVNCTWIKEWQSSASIADLIKNADVCIGILNPTGKSQRVWPFKNYLYMACGRPLITTRSMTSTRLQALAEHSIFYEVDTTDARNLANQIQSLIDDRDSLICTGQQALRFYEKNLSEEHIKKRLVDHLLPQ